MTTETEPRPGRRAKGEVRARLIEAGVELARHGGPDAVVLREATRLVGVAPNAAYRHFADRDALLNSVCTEAMEQLASRMHAELAKVRGRRGTKRAAMARLHATGVAYLDFARTEPGLFATAFAVPGHLPYASAGPPVAVEQPSPFDLLRQALDDLVTAGVLPAARRPLAEYPVWASVHGAAVLLNDGPLRDLSPEARETVSQNTLAFIERSI